jgi:hypothetical protein
MASKYPRQIEAGLTPANCWQVLSKRAQAQMQEWREAGEMSEREMVVVLFRNRYDVRNRLDIPYESGDYESKYARVISDSIDNARLAKDKAAEKEIRRYLGRFWYGGQPRD